MHRRNTKLLLFITFVPMPRPHDLLCRTYFLCSFDQLNVIVEPAQFSLIRCFCRILFLVFVLFCFVFCSLFWIRESARFCFNNFTLLNSLWKSFVFQIWQAQVCSVWCEDECSLVTVALLCQMTLRKPGIV